MSYHTTSSIAITTLFAITFLSAFAPGFSQNVRVDINEEFVILNSRETAVLKDKLDMLARYEKIFERFDQSITVFNENVASILKQVDYLVKNPAAVEKIARSVDKNMEYLIRSLDNISNNPAILEIILNHPTTKEFFQDLSKNQAKQDQLLDKLFNYVK